MIKFSSFDKFKKTSFEKEYPLLSKYFSDFNIRQNMLENADLKRKYIKYENTIESFIFELEKRFDLNTINKILLDSVIKLPDEILESLIISYLNSDEATKSNSEFIMYYNKTSNLGIDSINYVEKNGLITNRSFKDIPSIAIDQKYKELKTGNEIFKYELLSDVYDILAFNEKKLIVSLLENNSFALLEKIFESSDASLKTILSILIKKGITGDLINGTLISNLGSLHLILMIYMLIEADNTTGIINNLNKLIKLNKFDLIKNIIDENLLLVLGSININEEFINENEIMLLLKEKGMILEKVA